MSQQAKNIFCFCSEAKKKLFRINFDGSVGKPETRLFFLGLIAYTIIYHCLSGIVPGVRHVKV